MPEEQPVMRIVRWFMPPLKPYQSAGEGISGAEFSTGEAAWRWGASLQSDYSHFAGRVAAANWERVMTRTVKVSEFKAKCLKLLSDVAETGEDLVVTKRGKPLARVVAERSAKPSTLQGSMKGLIEILNPDKTLPSAWEEAEIDRRMDRLAENLTPAKSNGEP